MVRTGDRQDQVEGASQVLEELKLTSEGLGNHMN